MRLVCQCAPCEVEASGDSHGPMDERAPCVDCGRLLAASQLTVAPVGLEEMRHCGVCFSLREIGAALRCAPLGAEQEEDLVAHLRDIGKFLQNMPRRSQRPRLAPTSASSLPARADASGAAAPADGGVAPVAPAVPKWVPTWSLSVAKASPPSSLTWGVPEGAEASLPRSRAASTLSEGNEVEVTRPSRRRRRSRSLGARGGAARRTAARTPAPPSVSPPRRLYVEARLNYTGTSEPDTDQPHHRQQPGSVEDEEGFRCFWQARIERVEQHQRNLIPRPPAQPPH